MADTNDAIVVMAAEEMKNSNFTGINPFCPDSTRRRMKKQQQRTKRMEMAT